MKNKTNKILWVLLLLGLSFTTPLPAQRNQITFRHIYFDDEGNGLPTDHIGSVYQDRDGVMWLCTDDGLVKYDTYRYIYFKFDPEDDQTVSNNKINCFLEATDGTCYVGTKIGFNIFDKKTGKFKRFLHRSTDSTTISHNEIADVIQTDDGRILVATHAGIDVFNPLSGKFKAIPKTTDLRIHDLVQTADKKIYAGTENGLLIFQNKVSQHIPLIQKKEQIPVAVRAVFQDSKDNIWLATNDGLYRFFPKTLEYEKVFLGEKFKTISCTSIAEYPKNGQLFVGTRKHSLIHYDIGRGKVVRYYEYLAENRAGLSDPYVRGLTVDSHHNLWISTGIGLNIINPPGQQFKIYDNDPIAFSKLNYTRIIYVDSRSNIWMNTRRGLCRKLHLQDEVIPVTIPPNKATDNLVIPAIWEDKNKDVWIAVNNTLVKEVNGTKRFRQEIPSSFFKYSTIQKVVVDVNDPDLLWITTSTGLCTFNMQTHDSHWMLPSDYLKDISDNRTRLLTQQENGSIWFTIPRNLCVYHPERDVMESYLIDPTDSLSLISSKIEDMVATDNRIYIAGDKSFSYFDIAKKRFVNHTMKNNPQLKVSGFAAITLSDKGEVWFTGKGNLFRFRPRTDEIKTFVTFNLTSGCVKRCDFRMKNGNILFGSKRGIMVVNPDSIPKDTIVPRVRIAKISVFNKEYQSDVAPDYLDAVNLNYHENDLTFGFTALSYIVKSKVDYLVKMDGIDKDWVYIGYQREQEYLDLKPGEYTFWVKAINNDGIESKPVSIPITIRPPFWETYWFYSLITAILGLILYLLFANRQKTILLKKEKKIAEQHARYKSQFLSNMSHEIRTPMNAIMGLNKLMMASDLNPTQKEYTEAIDLSCENLLRIINDILDQAKIESGNLSIEKTVFDIRKVARQINTLFRKSTDEKNLEFKVEVDDKIPATIVGDPTRLFQVLTNLIGNAIKFTKRGGVSLFISLREHQLDKCTLYFEVNDTGVGIPADKLTRIFKSFEQIEHTDNAGFYGQRGTGLGLSIAKKLIELQGGEIQVRSKVGVGSRFFFSLPFDIRSTEARETVTSATMDFPKNLKILLVEDTPINRFLVIELLSKNLPGVAIESAENGQIAVEKVATKAYDLILMDVKMPVMNGLEATKAIRQKADPYFKEVPIMGLTANVIPQQINQCFEVGMNECVTKPIDVEELLTKIGKLMSCGTNNLARCDL